MTEPIISDIGLRIDIAGYFEEMIVDAATYGWHQGYYFDLSPDFITHFYGIDHRDYPNQDDYIIAVNDVMETNIVDDAIHQQCPACMFRISERVCLTGVFDIRTMAVVHNIIEEFALLLFGDLFPDQNERNLGIAYRVNDGIFNTVDDFYDFIGQCLAHVHENPELQENLDYQK